MRRCSTQAHQARHTLTAVTRLLGDTVSYETSETETNHIGSQSY